MERERSMKKVMKGSEKIIRIFRIAYIKLYDVENHFVVVEKRGKEFWCEKLFWRFYKLSRYN